MKKSELKSIIKECILEIFAESFGKEPAINHAMVAEVTSAAQTRTALTARPRPAQTATRNSMPESLIRSVIPDNGIVNKDVMSSIFADTATTTLLEQGKGEGRSPTVDTGIDPSIFEGSKNWAALAFSDSLENGR